MNGSALLQGNSTRSDWRGDRCMEVGAGCVASKRRIDWGSNQVHKFWPSNRKRWRKHISVQCVRNNTTRKGVCTMIRFNTVIEIIWWLMVPLQLYVSCSDRYWETQLPDVSKCWTVEECVQLMRRYRAVCEHGSPSFRERNLCP